MAAVKLRMAENSLFAILLRSSWWISAAIAIGVAALAVAIAPEAYRLFAAFAALPFVVIACIAGWKQLRMPSMRRVDDTLASLRAMSSQQLATLVEAALRAQGHAVERSSAPGADFEASKDGRVTLVHCHRFKVAQTGVGPLRELESAMRARDAAAGLYLAAGEVTAQARAFASANRIRLLDGMALVQWLPAAVARASATRSR